MNTYSITDLRQKTSKVLKDASDNGYVYVTRNSKKEAAVVDSSYLENLQDAYEDYLDIIEYDKTINEPRTSWKEYKNNQTNNK